MINSTFIDFLKHHPRGLILKELQCLSTLNLVTLFLRKKAQIKLIYRGEILHPSIKDGDELFIVDTKEIIRGDFILFRDDEGFPDIMRFLRAKDDALILVADAIAFRKMNIKKDSIIGVVKSIYRHKKKIPIRKFFCRPYLFPFFAFFNSIMRGIKEILQRPFFNNDQDAIKSVGEKYDIEAFQYRRNPLKTFEELNLNIVEKYIDEKSKILVAGSGIGHEAVALAKKGCQVLGIDISPKMIEISREKAKGAGVEARFELMDVSSIAIKDCDYSAVVFTPAVYSFIPQRNVRIKMMKKMHHILNSDGKLIFDVKGYRNITKFIKVSFSNIIFKLVYLFRKDRRLEFGDWHTKFLDAQGHFHFSFTKYFMKFQIKKEIERASYKVLDNIKSIWIIQKV